MYCSALVDMTGIGIVAISMVVQAIILSHRQILAYASNGRFSAMMTIEMLFSEVESVISFCDKFTMQDYPNTQTFNVQLDSLCDREKLITF